MVPYTSAAALQVLQVLKISHPPTHYLPVEDFAPATLLPAEGSSLCEWKGTAAHLSVVGAGKLAQRAARTCPNPTSSFTALRGPVAVYPGLMDECRVNDEVVRAQFGRFYGGWITSTVVGPFKAEAGSHGW